MNEAVSRRARSVSALNDVRGKIAGSGVNVIVVPVPRTSVDFARRSLVTGLPCENSILYWAPSRLTTAISFLESALTTDAPTPCRPPEVL